MAFETWALVEIMGHVRLAGHVTETTIAGAPMLRVDVPKTKHREPFTKYYGASAIYSITLTDEATARFAAEQFDQPPVSPYILRIPESPALAEKMQHEPDVVIRSDYKWDLSTNNEDDYSDDEDDEF